MYDWPHWIEPALAVWIANSKSTDTYAPHIESRFIMYPPIMYIP
jgi:hypothetical protein